MGFLNVSDYEDSLDSIRWTIIVDDSLFISSNSDFNGSS